MFLPSFYSHNSKQGSFNLHRIYDTFKVALISYTDQGFHYSFRCFVMQDKFKKAPVVLVTSEHLRTGKEYDAALIWIEDTTKDSFKVCLRELQNFDGQHQDIYVVCDQLYYF